MIRTPNDRRGELLAMIRQRHIAAFIDRAAGLAPADVVDAIAPLSPMERDALLVQMPPRLAAPILLRMVRMEPVAHPLASFDPAQLAPLIDALEDDDAAELLRGIVSDRRQRVLARLRHPAALEQLLSYPAWSAGGMMTSRMVIVTEVDTVAIATEEVRRQAAAIGDLAEIFVVDTARRLVGALPVKQLLLAPATMIVRDAMSTIPAHVGALDDPHVVAAAISRYQLPGVAVVDARGRLIGRVTAAAVQELALDGAAKDLLRFGGVPAGEASDITWAATVRNRLPWLYANLLTAFGAAAVVYFFERSLLQLIALAVWMPVVAGVGGNAGTQALATSVRRLVLDRSSSGGLRRAIGRELLIGLINGIAIGVVVAGVAVLLGESWRFGLVVCVATCGNLLVAGTAGAAIPSLLRRLGRDPALASPVFVTALTDACGFALLLGLASLMLL